MFDELISKCIGINAENRWHDPKRRVSIRCRYDTIANDRCIEKNILKIIFNINLMLIFFKQRTVK